MSDKKISDLVELTTLAADDVLPVVDASANATKRVTYDTLSAEVRDDVTPADFTLTSGDLPAGSIVQVVNSKATSEVTNATTNYIDTGLSASITPTSASNKIIAIFSQSVYLQRDTDDQGAPLLFERDGNPIWRADGLTSRGPFLFTGNSSKAQLLVTHTGTVLDNPSTTSVVEYKMRGRPWATTSSGQVVFQFDDRNDSTLTLLEVVA